MSILIEYVYKLSLNLKVSQELMNIEYRKIKLIRWIILLLLAVIPCLLLPEKFADMKLEQLIRHNNIDNSVKFIYADNREITCWKENPDDLEGISYVFLPSYADMEAIGVDTIAGRVDFESGSGCISVGKDEKRICAFRTDEMYNMVFYNTKEEIIGSKKLMFLKSGKLPTMYVATRSGSMEKLDADKRYKEKGAVELYDEEGRLLFADELRSISGRGNHSFSFDKKSYQVKLKTPRDVFSMGTSDTWILLSNVFDTAYIRNMLAYEMALQADMPGSPESEYIDVYFNGIYAGMYQLSEKVEIGRNRLDIRNLEEQNIALNGGSLEYVDTFISEDRKRKGTKLKHSPQDITGGYLLEHDYGDKFAEVTSGFVTDTNEAFALKSPEHASESEVDYISRLMQEIECAIAAADGYNPVTGKHFTEYIDMESWADKYLVEEITRNNGGGGTSSYFYKQQDAVSEKVFGGPVWDYDKGFGRLDGYNGNTRDLALLTLYNGYTSWFSYLYGHEEFVDAVKREYRDKFSGYLEVMAEEKADEYLARIEKSAVLDQARWGHVYGTYGEDTVDYMDEAGYIKQFIRERKAFMDEIWLEDAETFFVHFKDREGGGNRRFVVKAGECMQDYPTETKEGEEFPGWIIEDTGEPFNLQTPVTRDITVVGAWK